MHENILRIQNDLVQRLTLVTVNSHGETETNWKLNTFDILPLICNEGKRNAGKSMNDTIF